MRPSQIGRVRRVPANDNVSGECSLAATAAVGGKDGPSARGGARHEKYEHYELLVVVHLPRSPLHRLTPAEVARAAALTDILDFRAVKQREKA